VTHQFSHSNPLYQMNLPMEYIHYSKPAQDLTVDLFILPLP
jgi:hypothetical protein